MVLFIGFQNLVRFAVIWLITRKNIWFTLCSGKQFLLFLYEAHNITLDHIVDL